MPKPIPKPDKNRDPEEYKRFLETAKELGADQSPEAFDKAFKRIAIQAKAAKPVQKPKR